MTNFDTRLWTDLGGQLACTRHLGGYATQELEARPTAHKLTTPLTVWRIFTAKEQREFLRECGVPATCESCRSIDAVPGVAECLLGIPYANQEVIANRLFSRCPVCDALIEEHTDDTGERLTNSYSDHYQKEHQS